jgi:glyceraldehyde-3-phosphate dehydrogenase/erythrose-4-phosphate dehydrogenase
MTIRVAINGFGRIGRTVFRAAEARRTGAAYDGSQSVVSAASQLAGRLDGIAIRVPVVDGSVTDLTANLATDVTVEHERDLQQVASGSRRSSCPPGSRTGRPRGTSPRATA